MPYTSRNTLQYTNCWEDADLLLHALSLNTHDHVLSIGSAGDNTFSLLSQGPARVVAVDTNPAQLFLIELKKAAFATLDYDDFLSFLGFRPATHRLKLYQTVCKALRPPASSFWDQHRHLIQKGIIHTGKLERYFATFRKYLLPLIHSKKRVHELFQTRSAQEQATFYTNKWDNRRWRLLLRLFFSRRLMRWLGRKPEYLYYVQAPTGHTIALRTAAHLSSTQCTSNFYLSFILLGKHHCGLPHYARRENFHSIRRHLDRLQLVHSRLEDYCQHHANSFDAFNCSDMFEYLSPNAFRKAAHLLSKAGRQGARYAYWNLFVPRRLSMAHTSFETQTSLSKALTQHDRCFFYSNFYLDIKTT